MEDKKYFEKSVQAATYSMVDGTATQTANHTVGVTDGVSEKMYIDLALPTIYGSPRIKKATLTLHQQAASFSGTAPRLGLFRVTNGTSMAEDTRLVDCVEAQESGSYTFDITEAVMQMCRDYKIPKKLALRVLDEETEGTVTLCGSAGESNTPKLTVAYETAWGVDTGYPVRSHSIGGIVQADVDLYMGDLMLDFTDHQWGGNRMPVTLKHLYNSSIGDIQYSYDKDKLPAVANFAKMQLGLGWRLNVMQSMVLYLGRYVYTDETGRQTSFLKSDRKVTPEEGDPYYLYQSCEDEDVYYDPEKRTMELGGQIYQFDSVGKLLSITDEHGNAMTVTWSSGRIAKVTDGAGRKFLFAYDADNYLTAIKAPDGTAVSYTYLNGYLQKITRPDGTVVGIGTSTNNSRISMVRINDPAGSVVHQTSYTWDTYYAVSQLQQLEYAGSESKASRREMILYSPAEGKTRVIVSEPEDSGTQRAFDVIYTFDREGQLAGQYVSSDALGNRGVTEEALNAYLDGGAMDLADPGQNLLLNPRFVTTGFWVTTLEDEDKLRCANKAQSNTSNPTNATGARIQSLSQDNVAAGLTQTVGALAGENTLSVQVDSVSQCTGGGNPGLYLRVTDENGNILGESERLCRQDSNVRLSTTFTLEEAAPVNAQIVIDGEGSASVDCAKLENNGFVSADNLLKNGSFEGADGSWQLTENAALSQEDSFLPGASLKITGDLSQPGYGCQSTGAGSAAGCRKTYALSGWAKAAALPQKDGENAPQFRLRAVLHYTDGETESFAADFAPATTEWQYASVQFAKSRYDAVEDVEIFCDYSYNFGAAYFDNIQLTVESEETGLTPADFVDDVQTVSEEETEEESAVFEELMDAFGNVLTETTFHDGEFGTVYRSFGYDETGNDLIRETDARGNVTTYTVDPATSRNTAVTDRCGTRTAYAYDSLGRTTGVSVADPENAPLANVSYAYDSFDNLTAITRGDGMGYALAYDVYHNLESIGIEGKEEKLVTYGYKNKSRLKSVTYANGDKMEATYNSLGQLVTEKWFDAEGAVTAHYRYGYDDTGAVVRSVDFLAKKEYNYSYKDGQLIRSVQCDVSISDSGIVTGKRPVVDSRYSYADGQLKTKRVIYADGTQQEFRYENPEDGDTQVTMSTGGKSVTSRSKTDSFGRKIFDELQLGTGFVSRQFSYHAGDVTEEHQDNAKLKSSATTQLVSQIVLSDGRTISYEYDAEERITKVTDSIEGVTEYTYDAMGQLLTEVRDGTVFATMTYDAYGNILTKNGMTYTYGDPVWKDRLTAIDDYPITYDAQGNPINYLGHELVWEKGRQLKSYDDFNYTYNANGICTSRTIGGTTHYITVEGTKILREEWEGNALVPLYDNEEQVCGIEYNGTPYFFLKNLQGDVIAITDADGETVARYRYNAWGMWQILSDTSGCEIAGINPFRYRSYYLDTQTHLYYLQSRYYDPYTGRFINGDELFDEENMMGFDLFAYCGNCPTVCADYTGYGRTYVIYYNKPGSDFIKQAMNSPYYNKNSKSVYMKTVISARDFVETWNKMFGVIDYVFLYLHGGAGKLYLGQDTMAFSKGPGKTSFQTLNKKTVKKIYLFSCKGGAGKEGANVAWMFAKLTNARVIACTGSVSYSKIGGKYYARKAWDAGVIKTFYYRKKYNYWGPLVAKSVPGQW